MDFLKYILITNEWKRARRLPRHYCRTASECALLKVLTLSAVHHHHHHPPSEPRWHAHKHPYKGDKWRGVKIHHCLNTTSTETSSSVLSSTPPPPPPTPSPSSLGLFRKPSSPTFFRPAARNVSVWPHRFFPLIFPAAASSSNVYFSPSLPLSLFFFLLCFGCFGFLLFRSMCIFLFAQTHEAVLVEAVCFHYFQPPLEIQSQSRTLRKPEKELNQ